MCGGAIISDLSPPSRSTRRLTPNMLWSTGHQKNPNNNYYSKPMRSQVADDDFETDFQGFSDEFPAKISGGWRHTMALTSNGELYGWGWNKFGQVGVGDVLDHCSPMLVTFPHDEKVVQISCGWRHTLAVTERQNVYSWGRGTNGQLGHMESIDRNVPKIIEALSVDGSNGQLIESSNIDPSIGKLSVLPSDRYAVVPDDNKVRGQTVPSVEGTTSDASVPVGDLKRIRL